MNRTKIEWADYTWNPLVGCLRGCSYCYARRIANRFQGHFRPTFHPERLSEPARVKKPSRIFVCSMADLYAPWVLWAWQIRILEQIEKALWHNFFILTKYPDGICGSPYSKNLWIGVSVEASEDAGRIAQLRRHRLPHRFISFEPLLGPINSPCLVDWVIIGAQTGPGAKPPKPEWVQTIIDACRKAGTPIFIKNNINWSTKIQEFPG